MRVGHVRELHGPAGQPWRLAAAPSGGGSWLDLEGGRRRLLAADPQRSHNAVLFRPPITTLDHHLDRGLRTEAIGGYLVLNDWSARDIQRDETTVRLGPAKGKDFATTIGPWITTPDEIADALASGATGPELTMTAIVRPGDESAGGSTPVEISHGSWSSAQFSFGAMLARACADVHVRPGELLGSGTVGGGCLLEVKDETLGRWLEPGDEVVLSIERLGELRSPIVARGSRP